MGNSEPRISDSLPAAAGALAVGVAGVLTLLVYELGPQSRHMAFHIAAMNVVAPLAAALLIKKQPAWMAQWQTLWLSAAGQILLLWAWHVPSVQHAAAGSHGLHMLAHATLFVSAFVFWGAITSLPEGGKWQGIAALLLTGKLACLLSALLIFSPRALYTLSVHGPQLDDQQLAGLLMITACPLSYLVAAVTLASQLINRLARTSRPASFRTG